MSFDALISVFCILIIIGFGVLAARLRWVDMRCASKFPVLIMNLSLPAQIICSFNTYFTGKLDTVTPALFLIPLICITVIGLIAWGVSYLIKLPKERRCLFIALCAFGNNGFVGMPLMAALYGDEGVAIGSFYMIVLIIISWTAGLPLIHRDGIAISGTSGKLSVSKIIKGIVSMPAVALVVGLVLSALNVRLPEIVLVPAELLGDMTTPLSMIYIGVMLYCAGKKAFKYERGMISAVVLRLIVPIAAAYVLCRLFSTDDITTKVYCIQSILPSATACTIIAASEGADTDYSVKGILWTTVPTLLTVPLFVILLS